MTNETLVKILKNECLGCEIVSSAFYDSGTIQLNLSKEDITDFASLIIGNSWRIIRDNMLVVGVLDEEELIKSELALIRIKEIIAIEFGPLLCDLTLIFNDDSKLESFSNSFEGDKWEYCKPNGYRLGLGEFYKPYEVIAKY